MSVRDLAAQLAPGDPAAIYRLGVVTGVDFSTRDPVTGLLSPPTLTIGAGEFARPMRFLGKVSDYNIGQTVSYILRGGAPLVVAPVPVVGEDPLDVDYEGENWTAPTLTNSWVNYGAPYDTAGYYKQNDGWVRLKGLIKNGSSATADMFTLPDGYRPPFEMYATVHSGTGGAARLRITTAGVASTTDGGSTTYLSLNGVTFPTAWNEAAWPVLRLLGSWFHDPLSEGSTPEMFVRDDGWCWVKGIVADTVAAATDICTLPEDGFLRRLDQMLSAYTSAGVFNVGHRVDVQHTGSMRHQNATATALTIGNMNWFGAPSTPVIDWTDAALAGGWSHYTATGSFQVPGYYKDHFGVVHLRGLGTSANANPTTAFTLPVGYRPAQDQPFIAMGNSNLSGRCDVLANGQVQRIAGNAGFFSFDNISFRADQ